MTISITVPGAEFTEFVSNVLLPYIEDAVSFQLYGTDAASSVLNRSLNPTANASVVGTPTYGTGFATISNTNGFDTGYLVDTPFTQVLAMRWVSGSTSPVGRVPGDEEFIDMIQVLGTDAFGPGTLKIWPNGVGGVGIDIPDAPATEFNMFGMRWGGTGTKSNIYYHSGPALIEASPSTNDTKTVTPTLNLRVGACGTGAGSWKVAASAFYNRLLSNAELFIVHSYLQGLLASRGVTLM